MASRTDPLFTVAERLILSLYDGGVLSPAVLERVIVAHHDARWETAANLRANDDRSVREVVVAVMMPGNALDQVDQDFAAVIEHIVETTQHASRRGTGSAKRAAGKAGKDAEPPSQDNTDDADSDDSGLLEQLAGTSGTANRKTKPSREGGSTRAAVGFNPLRNAAAPKKR